MPGIESIKGRIAGVETWQKKLTDFYADGRLQVPEYFDMYIRLMDQKLRLELALVDKGRLESLNATADAVLALADYFKGLNYELVPSLQAIIELGLEEARRRGQKRWFHTFRFWRR